MEEKRTLRKARVNTLRFKKLWRLLAVSGSVLSVVALAVSLVSGWFVVKLYRYVDTAQKTMPVLRKAAQLYMDRCAAEEASGMDTPDGKRVYPRGKKNPG